jgi:hypothetical protein
MYFASANSGNSFLLVVIKKLQKTRRQEKGIRDKKKQQIKELGNDTYHIFDAVQKLKDVQSNT